MPHRMIYRAGRLVAGVRDAVLPPTCHTCERILAEHGGLCTRCWSELRLVRAPLCPVMGRPFSHDMGKGFLCAEAIADPPPFSRLRSFAVYNDKAAGLVSALKYADRSDLARWLSRLMAAAGAELLEDADMVVPIPLHPSRLRDRRFNQAAELARHLAKHRTGLEYDPMSLVRKRRTKAQVGLSAGERARNVSGAFQVPQSHRIKIDGRSILLVDDVYTTGATVKAATRALLRSGAARVDVLVFAKVESGLD